MHALRHKLYRLTLQNITIKTKMKALLENLRLIDCEVHYVYNMNAIGYCVFTFISQRLHIILDPVINLLS